MLTSPTVTDQEPVRLRSDRILGLDVLRFLAVTLVFLRHVEKPDASYGLLRDVFEVLGRGGWIGVDLFFVLSGFLVAGLLFQEWKRDQRVSIGRFLIRRALKIYPPFYAMLAFTFLLYLVSGPPNYYCHRYLIGELLFLQNYLGGLWNHTWSLAVEEHFYLFLALCVFLAVRRHGPQSNPFRFVTSLFVWTACTCLFLRLLTAVCLPSYHGRIIMYATHLRIDSLMLGVFLSFLWHFHLTEIGHAALYRARFALSALGILFLAPAFLYDYAQYSQHRWITVWGFSLFSLGGACLMLGCLKIFGGDHARWLNILSYLGSRSYSVYLWHSLALGWAYHLVHKLVPPEHFWPVYSVSSFVLMWGLGVGAAKLVEIPVLRLRDRFFPSRTAPR
jgi:peptidoglycan/LPS O-acetylase OafA/YrhL